MHEKATGIFIRRQLHAYCTCPWSTSCFDVPATNDVLSGVPLGDGNCPEPARGNTVSALQATVCSPGTGGVGGALSLAAFGRTTSCMGSTPGSQGYQGGQEDAFGGSQAAKQCGRGLGQTAQPLVRLHMQHQLGVEPG